jgi:hypothetical protein
VEYPVEEYSKAYVFAPSGSANLTISKQKTPAIANSVPLMGLALTYAVWGLYAVLLSQ